MRKHRTIQADKESCQNYSIFIISKILNYFQNKAMLIININSSFSIHRDNYSDSFPKLRSVECAILANYITDFHHNQRKYKEQYTMLQKEFDSVERDGMWRAKCELKK